MAIYLLDDDGSIYKIVERAFPDSEIKWYRDSKGLIDSIESELSAGDKVDLVVLDLNVQRNDLPDERFLAPTPDREGLYVLNFIKSRYRDLPVILMTKYPDKDVFAKVLLLNAKAIEISDMEFAVEKLRENFPELSGDTGDIEKLVELFKKHGFIVESPLSVEVIKLASKFSKNKEPIVITGEIGVGKDELARAIAKIYFKNEKMEKFDIGNFSNDPDKLHQSLFGVCSKSFTNVKARKGLFETAGVLILMEIGDLNLELQGKLLEVIEERTFTKLGGCKGKFEGKLILTTNKNLKEMVRRGEFRKDLYNRIFVQSIYIPPLRERRDDIPALIKSIAPELRFTDAAWKYLTQEYDYPGNVRTLKNMLKHFTSTGLKIVQLEDVIRVTMQEGYKYMRSDEISEENFIVSVFQYIVENEIGYRKFCDAIFKTGLEHFGTTWKQNTWGKKLGIPKATFYRKLKHFNNER